MAGSGSSEIGSSWVGGDWYVNLRGLSGGGETTSHGHLSSYAPSGIALYRTYSADCHHRCRSQGGSTAGRADANTMPQRFAAKGKPSLVRRRFLSVRSANVVAARTHHSLSRASRPRVLVSEHRFRLRMQDATAPVRMRGRGGSDKAQGFTSLRAGAPTVNY